ncbi:MAG: hypothetical protein IT371_02810 [Deltaproteobacteria bacterium]|nr:hypothetical protein [Deltaproteobacteria bacterium]
MDNGLCQTSDGVACLFNETGSGDGTSGTTPGVNTPTEPTSPGTPGTPGTPAEQLTPEQGGCWFTGGGTFGKGDTRDSFGGNAMTMKAAPVRGEWNHVDHHDVTGTTINGQNHLVGRVTYIACKKYPSLKGPQVPKAEPNYVNFGGVGKFNGKDGHFFDVRVFDHAEGGILRDRYAIDVYGPDKKLVHHADGQGTESAPSNKTCKENVDVTPDLAWVKEMGCLSGGNMQIHPPNTGHPY